MVTSVSRKFLRQLRRRSRRVPCRGTRCGMSHNRGEEHFENAFGRPEQDSTDCTVPLQAKRVHHQECEMAMGLLFGHTLVVAALVQAVVPPSPREQNPVLPSQPVAVTDTIKQATTRAVALGELARTCDAA